MADQSHVFTAELFAQVLRRLANGETLHAICRAIGFDPQAVYAWKRGDPQREGDFDEARQMGFDAIAEDSIEIVDGLKPVQGVPMDAGRDKARAEHRLKLLRVWDPRRYGERVQLADADGGRLALAPMVADVMGLLRGAAAQAVEVTVVEALPAPQRSLQEAAQDVADLI